MSQLCGSLAALSALSCVMSAALTGVRAVATSSEASRKVVRILISSSRGAARLGARMAMLSYGRCAMISQHTPARERRHRELRAATHGSIRRDGQETNAGHGGMGPAFCGPDGFAPTGAWPGSTLISASYVLACGGCT